MRLYLMRHGQAENPVIDPDQGLTEDGKIAIRQIADELVQKSVSVNQVLHSTKKRARQTAMIVSEIISPGLTPRAMENLKPGDNPEKIIGTLNQWTEDTLVVSHLPFIPSLLSLLTKSSNTIRFEPGTVACLTRSDSKWKLEWYISQ